MHYISLKNQSGSINSHLLSGIEYSAICDTCREIMQDVASNESNFFPSKSVWWHNIQVNDNDLSGRKVVEIISVSQSHFIYFDEKNNLNYAVYLEEKTHSKLFVEFHKLQQKILRTLSGESQKQSAQALGIALGQALSQANTKDVCCCFTDISEFVETKCKEKLKKYYISSTFLCCLLFVFFALLLNAIGTDADSLLTDLKIASFGGVGAMISVLQRFKKMQINTYTSPSYIVFEGFSRIILGTFFGVILMLAVKSNIMFGNYMNSLDALSLFAIIAGLSERLIPEFIETIEIRNRRQSDKLFAENQNLNNTEHK